MKILLIDNRTREHNMVLYRVTKTHANDLVLREVLAFGSLYDAPRYMLVGMDAIVATTDKAFRAVTSAGFTDYDVRRTDKSPEYTQNNTYTVRCVGRVDDDTSKAQWDRRPFQIHLINVADNILIDKLKSHFGLGDDISNDYLDSVEKLYSHTESASALFIEGQSNAVQAVMLTTRNNDHGVDWLATLPEIMEEIEEEYQDHIYNLIPVKFSEGRWEYRVEEKAEATI